MTDPRLLCEHEPSVTELLYPEEAIFKSSLPAAADRREIPETPWIEYVAGQWVVLKRRRDVPQERRGFHVMRKHIEKLLDQGWSITGRDPVRLERHQQVKIVKDGVLIDG
ncbi:hypothetical protein Pres01_56210 [Metapseudomonas resinovorans]|uniref:hypothetical protein n=1 Tax=Metapseudomonas resinovorans TaxID=53412 RepID=UPI0009867424|nr:hypothetical protein [Pseudomonas resinovorans]GLZ89570.1 hypothetical protein Pres01_56210 [Pseudomonas resinovorans]